VRVQGVTALFGGIAFDVDHLNRDALRSIEQLVSKYDWIIIQVPCDPQVYSLNDLRERSDCREMRREEFRKEQLERNSQA
jgi:predicted secreted protein